MCMYLMYVCMYVCMYIMTKPTPDYRIVTCIIDQITATVCLKVFFLLNVFEYPIDSVPAVGISSPSGRV